MPNRTRLLELGWKQGALLLPGEHASLIEHVHYDIPENSRLLIVSQTCDLIQGSFDSEPYFEVLCITPLDSIPDGNYAFGKNNRRIEFSLVIGGIANWYSHPFNKHIIAREVLLEITPTIFLSNEKDLRMLVLWLTKRYTRVAFPDTFINRIKSREKQIGKKFSQLNEYVEFIYIRVSSFEELENDSEYSIEIFLVMDAEKFDTKNLNTKCCEIKDQLDTQINKCSGILVNDITVTSTADLTIEELKGYLEWDYSYLSFRSSD